MKYKTIPSTTGLYFVTSRVAGYHSVFVNHELCTIVMESLSWFRSKSIWKLYSYCLMPNHLHVLVQLCDGTPIEKVMGQFHSFTGHRIARYLKRHKGPLEFFQRKGSGKGDREILIWEDSLAKCIETEYVLLKTIDYIHNNPLNKNWHLVDERSEYLYSSACFLDEGVQPLIEMDDYQELLGGTPSH